MDPKRIKTNPRPESKLERDFERFMKARDWFVKKMHGSKYQAGFPDYYCTHIKYRVRLVELKDPNRTSDVFTPAQLETFPLLSAHGSPIWVITAANEQEYSKLFGPENWWAYLDLFRK